MALKPGTTVPIKVLRDKQEKTLNVTIGELDLESEGNQQSADQRRRGLERRLRHLARQPHRRSRTHGLACRPARPARSSPTWIRMAAPHGPGSERATSFSRSTGVDVDSAAAAQRELQKVRSGATAFLLVWRQNQEIFFTIRKE